ncbi:MAG TPA: mandelate racemase/muconate lactonizing enzyme family protein [Polyangiaceae bacterium]
MTRLTRLIEQSFRVAPGAEPEDALRSWSERRTLLVVAEDDAGNQGVGEASPLPGYSPDTLDDAWDGLRRLLGQPLPDLLSGVSRSLSALGDTLSSPAARFGFDSALLDLWSRKRAEPARVLLASLAREMFGFAVVPEAPYQNPGCSVAALLPSGAERALAHAHARAACGIDAFKVKIGAPCAWDEELRTLVELRKCFPNARLRVDANQSLSPETLAERRPALRSLELEWLEEPILDFRGVPQGLGVPLALDESLQTNVPDAGLLSEHHVRAYVLKPTTLGGFLPSLELAENARSAEIASVVSHAYEGPIGFAALAALALTLGPGRPSDGLDLHPGLAGETALPAFDPARGRIRAWTEPGFGIPLDTLLERREITREARA